MESNDGQKSKKLNDDVMIVLGRLSETEQVRITPRLKSYVDLQQKRHRADIARRHAEKGHAHDKKNLKEQEDHRDKPGDDRKHGVNHEGRPNTKSGDKCVPRRSVSPRSRSMSGDGNEPTDRCCRRRRRRRRSCGRRRRRRSCRRRRRRRRSCRRRRRRRSGRRRRRRSCRRRRRRRC